MSASANPADYSTLVFRAQPKVIHSEEQNESFIRAIEELDSRWDTLTTAEKELHELLLLLVQDFESRAYSLRRATPVEVITELMEANGLKPTDLIGVFETASVVSEVLSGKREITKEHIRRLSDRFGVSPELFF